VSSYVTGWRLALRLARRDLLKHRSRAIIALVMVTLPVLAVVTADVLIQTADVTAQEGIDRRIGTVAAAKLEATSQQLTQSPDPYSSWGSSGELDHPAGAADIERIIGHRDMAAGPVSGEVLVETPHGREPVSTDQLDPAAPLARGLYRLDSGRWPAAADEVVVNQALLDRGIRDTLTVVGRDKAASARTIVGTITDARRRSSEVVVGLPGSLPSQTGGGEVQQAWLVDGAPITWSQVQQLNDIGVLVTDRYITTHLGEFPDPMAYDDGVGDTTVQVAALIVVMALIEVVLLAGPAIAVGARKQQRSLALLVASGGTPAQARRVILAGGVLLGLSAAVVGVVAGIGAAWLLRPLVQRFSWEWLGPFDVPWLHLLAVAAFGLVSAFLACLVPAWIASRQNVVAVLAGRRGDAKPVRAFPVLGVGLFVIGVLMAVEGARGRGDLTVAWSAVVCVLGMVLLVPVVVGLVARAAGRLPLPVRFAARDAVRHRTRTTPAVAAVAATVAGVVALGISTASDAKENRESYTPSLHLGDAAVTASYDYYLDAEVQPTTDWDRVADVVREHAPEATVTPVTGAGEEGPGSSATVTFTRPGATSDDEWIAPSWYSSALGSDVIVSDGSSLPPVVEERVPGVDLSAALAAGRVVVFTSDEAQSTLDRVDVHVQTADENGEVTQDREVTVPALVVAVDPETSFPARALVPPSVAERAGVRAATVSLSLTGAHLSKAAEKDLAAALRALPTPAGVYVERGYEAPDEEAIVQWVLAGLGAILMLGGTLTASFLALSDARPDLATLAAVGATPRTRRGVAAAYTFVVGFVGAVLGMLVGFVPGIAITWPLTAEGYAGDHGPYLSIPWLMIAVVVIGLPLLTAAVVALFTRSRLPMVSRLS
jgi:putative ABC transport system permease protein